MREFLYDIQIPQFLWLRIYIDHSQSRNFPLLLTLSFPTENIFDVSVFLQYWFLQVILFWYLQVQGVKENDQVFALVVVQADFFELAINHRGALERGSWLLDFGSHFLASLGDFANWKGTMSISKGNKRVITF